jgi:hypothetical protein
VKPKGWKLDPHWLTHYREVEKQRQEWLKVRLEHEQMLTAMQFYATVGELRSPGCCCEDNR